MSLYPQSQAYGQIPFGAPGYPHAMPPPGAYNYPPPPQPVFHVDPNTFRRDYMSRLAELTINSRPVIQNLSMIAQEYSRYAEIVAQCIESHIRRVPPWMKLPAFYLLDAISKNVFDPYARYFTPLVVKLFLDTYEVVDQNTRSKMEEMLLTWRTGAPNGRELFGVGPQVTIERQIWGGDTTQNSLSNRQPGQPSISTAQVLSELEFVLGQKERALQSNPYDKHSQTHITVLHQLRKLVQAGVSQEELGQILNQLRTLAPPPPAPVVHAPPPVAPISHPYPSQSSYPQPTVQSGYPVSTSQAPYPQQPTYPTPSLNQPKSEPVDLLSLMSAQPVTTTSSSSSAAPPAAPAVSNFANLFSALVKAGVVSASATPTGAGATAKAETPQPVDLAKDTFREYRKAILSIGVKLTSGDILRQRPAIVRFLYDQQPNQCKQCGVRFPDSTTGKKNMEHHLDMHFRQNRKASQASGRGHSRGWFVGVEDWIHDGAIDVKGKGRADGSGSMNSKAAAAAEAAKLEAELRAMHVVVPPGDEAKSIFCPICKEPLKSEFLEDDEEWVWRNAIRKDDKIYHATCHAEAAASKSHLAARLRNEVSSRSRSRTPEARSPPKSILPLNGESRKSESPSPSKVAGVKRKAEDYDQVSSSSKAEGLLVTPPMKKIALSSTS